MKVIGRQFAIFSISPLFWILVVFSLIFQFEFQFGIALSVAILHELAHIIMAAFCGVGIERIQLDCFGISAKLARNLPKQQIPIYLAGPAANLFFACLFYFVAPLKFLVNFNLAMAILNLLPIYPLDGGRIIRAVIELTKNKIQAVWISNKISAFFSSILIFAILIFFWKYKLNLPFLLIISFLIFQLFY